jgi:hypothetical protein
MKPTAPFAVAFSESARKFERSAAVKPTSTDFTTPRCTFPLRDRLNRRRVIFCHYRNFFQLEQKIETAKIRPTFDFARMQASYSQVEGGIGCLYEHESLELNVVGQSTFVEREKTPRRATT